jgi:hypothetical protein
MDARAICLIWFGFGGFFAFLPNRGEGQQFLLPGF